jgi:hypothetical protein
MSMAIDQFLLDLNFERINRIQEDYYYYKKIDEVEYLVFTYKDCNEVYIKGIYTKSKKVRLLDHQVEEFFKPIIRKQKIKKLLDESK